MLYFKLSAKTTSSEFEGGIPWIFFKSIEIIVLPFSINGLIDPIAIPFPKKFKNSLLSIILLNLK